MTKQKAFNLVGFHESVRRDYQDGLITLTQAAEEFYAANWTKSIDLQYAWKQLNPAN